MVSENILKIQNRFQCIIPNDLITSVYTYLENHSQDYKTDFENYVSKETEQKLLEEFVLKNNLIYENLPFATYLDEGAEQKVFYFEKDKKVIKLNDAIFYVNWSQFFESLIIHNILFKETNYTLIGFVKINNLLYAVVQQDFIMSNQNTDIEEVRNYMIDKGFSLKRRNDYTHSELGIIIEDLHEENVLKMNNTLFFIHTVIYLK